MSEFETKLISRLESLRDEVAGVRRSIDAIFVLGILVIFSIGVLAVAAK